MRDASRCSSVWTVILFVAVSGCVSHSLNPYPAAWPSLVTTSDCADVSGRYRNEASATTLWRSPTIPATARAYLANLLADGTPGSVSTVQANIMEVVIDATRMSYRAIQSSHPSDDTGISSGHWACMPDGRLLIRFEREMLAEDSVGRVKIAIALQRANDHSLIVREEVKIRSIDLGVIPSGQETLDWARFDALPDK